MVIVTDLYSRLEG